MTKRSVEKKLAALITAMAMAFSVIPVSFAAPVEERDDSLVLYYSFDNDSAQPDTIIDDSGNGLDGQIVGSAWSWPGGGPGGPGGWGGESRQLTVERGTAVFPGFTGSGWWTQVGEAIKIPEALKEKIPDDYTISMWVKPDSSYSFFSSGLQRFFDFGSSLYNSIFLRYSGASGQLRFQDRGIALSANDASSYMEKDSAINADEWSLITVTYSAQTDTATLYVNGERILGESKFTRAVKDVPSPESDTYGMFIGRTQWWDDGERDNNPDFCGRMDEVRIYNRIIGEDEIAALYADTDPDAGAEAQLTTEYPAVADTYTSSQYYNTSYGDSAEIQVTSTQGRGRASYDRNAFLRFENPGSDGIAEAKIRLYMRQINNNSNTTYTLYALNNSNWDENEITWNNQGSFTEGETAVSTASYRPSQREETVNDWLDFDITNYIKNIDADAEYMDFHIVCSTCATYFDSSEGEHAPVLSIVTSGKRVQLNYMCDGEVLSSKYAYAPKEGPYTFPVESAISQNGSLYVYESGAQVADAADITSVDIQMRREDNFTVADIDAVSAYVDDVPVLPARIMVSWDGGSAELAAAFEEKTFPDPGVYELSGDVGGIPVSASVKVYGRWLDSSGQTVDRASKVILNLITEDGSSVARPIEASVRTGTSFSAERAIDDFIEASPHIGVVSLPQDFIASEPVYELEVVCEVAQGVSGVLRGELTNAAQSSYDMTATARIINTAEADALALLAVAGYSGGAIDTLNFKTIELPGGMTEAGEYSLSVPYDRENGDDVRAFLWTADGLRPLSEAVLASELSVYSDEIRALIPDYETVRENVLRTNDMWQYWHKAADRSSGYDIAFWDNAAYLTGNMEAYFTFGNSEYLEYAFDWANAANWRGNTNTGDKENWNDDYSESKSGNSVLFGDWQACFQTFLDLNMIDPDRSDIGRVEEVIGYQITRPENDFWWWCDALYMVPPVMTKLYLTTGNEAYLDALYRYYSEAKTLLYDGEGGCGYTTDENYSNLFFRDRSKIGEMAGGERNMWARGNGWVLAGLAKVISDLPTDYEHRDFFTELFCQMSEAVIACQQVDDEGRGFWTQAMLANYPRGSGNEWGYETSGTAFLTYGLFWGINSGLLSEKTFLEPALRGWKYLSEVALQESGKIGYVQGVGSGSNTTPTQYEAEQNFGYGAYLLAGCEVSRWVGGVSENNEPYLKRKLWSASAVNGSKYYVNGEVVENTASFTDSGRLWIPSAGSELMFGMSVVETASGGYRLSGRDGLVLEIPQEDFLETGDGIYISADFLALTAGKHISTYGDVTVFSHKRDVFYECDANSIKYLNEIMN